MSHLLPPLGHPAREAFDLVDLVAIGEGRRAPLLRLEARGLARRFFENAPAGAKRVFYFILRAEDDQLVLGSFGRRLGYRQEWVFGPYRAPR